jgi:saccharopine dehydrogenase-like NADP-dependent oxidoreductase
MTDDSYTMDYSGNQTWLQFTESFLPAGIQGSITERLGAYLNIPSDGAIMNKLAWLGLFENKPVGLNNATPAQILQLKLEQKWGLEPNDKDMIVMQHVFDYQMNEKHYQHKSSLVVIGKDQRQTAMAMTVGTPLAIATRLVLTGKIRAVGVQVPTTREFYLPILTELEQYGIKFIEEEEEC